MLTHSFIHLITRRTSFGAYHSSLVNNIVTSQRRDTSIAGILISDTPDNLYIILIIQEISNHEKKVKSSRVTTAQNIVNFKLILNAIDWSDIDTAGDVDVAHDILNKFTEACNKTFTFIHKLYSQK